MSKTAIGIGVAGAGYAARMHLQAWRDIEGARVIGIYDPDAERVRPAAKDFGAAAFASLDDLVAHPQVDAVDIASVVEAHKEAVLLAAARKKTVLCQKPMAETYEDAKHMVAACDAAGVRFMVNENWRWRPWYRAAKEILRKGTLGKLHYLNFNQAEPSAVEPNPADELTRTVDARGRPIAGRKIVLNAAPHVLDVTRLLFGGPADVFARTLKATQSPSDEELAVISLGYPGRVAQVELNWATIAPKPFQPDHVVLAGSDGTLNLERDGAFYIDRRDGRREVPEVDATDYYPRSWSLALRHFVDCMQNDKPFETSGEDNLRTLAILFAAYRSASEGRPVALA